MGLNHLGILFFPLFLISEKAIEKHSGTEKERIV